MRLRPKMILLSASIIGLIAAARVAKADPEQGPSHDPPPRPVPESTRPTPHRALSEAEADHLREDVAAAHERVVLRLSDAGITGPLAPRADEHGRR